MEPIGPNVTFNFIPEKGLAKSKKDLKSSYISSFHHLHVFIVKGCIQIRTENMNKLLEQILWFGIALGMTHSLALYVYRCTVFLEQASSIKTVTLEIIQPSTGPASLSRTRGHTDLHCSTDRCCSSAIPELATWFNCFVCTIWQ